MVSAFCGAYGHSLGSKVIREESVGGSLKNRPHNRRSVILPDISIGSVEEVLISVQLVLQERPPEFLLHQALALKGVLPSSIPDITAGLSSQHHCPLKVMSIAPVAPCHL